MVDKRTGIIRRMIFVATILIVFFIFPIALGAETNPAGTKSQGVVLTGTLTGFNKAILGICATLAVGISCTASAYALAKIGSAALGAMSEKPEIGGRALIFLGMAEGIAIYGLIIAIMLLTKI